MEYLSPQRQQELAAKAQAGDSHAFGVLYEHLQLALTGHVSGRLSGSEDIEDVVGDCFLLALKAVRQGTFDPQYSFYTFLRGIADNEIKRFLKREYVQIPRRGASPASSYVPKVLAIPEGRSPQKDAWRSADQILANLPLADAEAVAAELLRLVLSSPTKPHQNLAFCLIRFLEWRPREVVDELSARSLLDTAERIYESFAVLFPGAGFGEGYREQHCPGFWSRLERPVADVYRESEYEQLRSMSPGRTGDLLFEAFYGPSPTASLSDWCDKVRKRARRGVAGDMSNGG